MHCQGHKQCDKWLITNECTVNENYHYHWQIEKLFYYFQGMISGMQKM